MHSTWFSHEPDRLNDTDLTDERIHGRLLDRLGQWGLRDARKGLAELGHPAAASPRRIWTATHDRAVIEESWRVLLEHVATGTKTPAFDQYELQKLLAYPDQWIRLRWWAWRLRSTMTRPERELWDGWREKWWPWNRNERSTRKSY